MDLIVEIPSAPEKSQILIKLAGEELSEATLLSIVPLNFKFSPKSRGPDEILDTFHMHADCRSIVIYNNSCSINISL